MRFFAIIIFSFLAQVSFSQYTVTKVIGNVKKKSGEKIGVGSKLKETDVLVFSKPEDMVRVIITGKGTYVLTPSPKAVVEKNAFVEMLKSTKLLKSKEGYLSSRGQFNELVPDVFKTIDSINSKILIVKENYYLFDPERYNIASIAGRGKFILQALGIGSTFQNKTLKTKGDTLFISLSDFRFQSGFSIFPYELIYYDYETKTERVLVKIDPYFDQTGEMEKIIRVVVRETSIKDDETLVQQEAYEEVYEALGKPSDLVFENTFRKVMKQLKKTK